VSPVQVHRSAIPPRDLLELFAASDEYERFYWERPESGEAILALGAVARIQSCGPLRFGDAAGRVREIRALLRKEGDAPPWAGPLLVGGFAFDFAMPPSERWLGFSPAELLLPERLLIRRGGEMWVCRAGVGSVSSGGDEFTAAPPALARLAAADDSPPAFHTSADRPLGAYRGLVEKALGAIGEGELEKVVVARSCTVVGSRPFETRRVLRSLRALHPSCTIFALARGPVTFLGATPERLVRLEKGLVHADAVAGTAPRGRTPQQDRCLARELVESKKDQEEHSVVVRCVLEALAPHCGALLAPESPGLLQTDGIQHLHTPIQGRLRDPSNTTVLDLAGELHPTPAVGGAPRETALAWLRCHEGLDRGWYAGSLGWLTPEGEGEFTVALRSLLLRGSEATLFAGAGIVAGSDPDAELLETRLKLRTALAALLEI
jgi:salicylate biosynthesis isochorismate synthase/menaquinone-specific isochorismate synthase